MDEEESESDYTSVLTDDEKNFIQKYMKQLATLINQIREPMDPRIEGLLVISGQLLEQQLEMDLRFQYTDDSDGKIPSSDDLKDWFK
jgi:hypothetical protein